jgi:hypothetical protein
MELKTPKKAITHPADHEEQISGYISHLFSRHPGTETMPIVLMNGVTMYIGVATWSSFAEVEISMSHTAVKLYDRYALYYCL